MYEKFSPIIRFFVSLLFVCVYSILLYEFGEYGLSVVR